MTVGKYMQKVSVEEAAIDSLAHLMNAECKIPSSHDSGLCSCSARHEENQGWHGDQTHRIWSTLERLADRCKDFH